MRGHQINVAPASVHVTVRIGGTVIAESDRPVLLDETGLPTRYYLPRDDIRMDLLEPTSTTTTCPFKGEATYWSLKGSGEAGENIVWSYQAPLPSVSEIARLLCFYNDRVGLIVGHA